MKDTSTDIVGGNFGRNAQANENLNNQNKNNIKGNQSKQFFKHNVLIT